MKYKSIERENTIDRSTLDNKCYSLEESKRLLIKKIKSISTTKCFLVLFFSAIVSHSFAQITTLGAPAKEEPQIIIPQYDSLSNFKIVKYSGTEERGYKHLVGQKVYVLNTQESQKLKRFVWGYSDLDNRDWKLEGHYMTIIDRGPRHSWTDGGSWQNAYDISFKDETDGMVYCFEKSDYNQININRCLVVVGHYEKMKQLYEGKELVFVQDDDKTGESLGVPYNCQNGIFDINTRNRVLSIKKGTRFLCTGVSIDDYPVDGSEKGKAYVNIPDRVVILLHNDELGDFYCYATSQDMDDDFDKKIQARCKNYILGKFLFPEDYAKKQKNDAVAAKKKKEADQAKAEENQAKAKERQEKEQQRIQALVDKYGQSNVNLARQGKVKIGWNKELCKEAWGEPRSINKTTTVSGVHEQWVYTTSRYLYFDDGILTAIQE